MTTFAQAIEAYQSSVAGKTARQVAEELTVSELNVPLGSAAKMDPDGRLLVEFAAKKKIPAGEVERTKFESTAYNQEFVRPAVGKGGKKKAWSAFSERWRLLVDEKDAVRQEYDAGRLAQDCKETIVSQAFVSSAFDTETFNALCRNLMDHQLTPTFVFACVYFAELCWRSAQYYARAKFANSALGEVFFVVWLDGCDTNYELVERMILTMPFDLPERQGADLYPGLQHMYDAYAAKVAGETTDSVFPSEALSPEGQQTLVTFEIFSESVLEQAEAAIKDNSDLRGQLQKLYDEGTARIEELTRRAEAAEARAVQSEQQVADIGQQAQQFAQAVTQNADARVAEVANQANVQIEQLSSSVQQAQAVSNNLEQQAAVLQQERDALQETVASKDAVIQATAARSDEEARARQAATALAAKRKAELEEKQRRLAALRGQIKSKAEETDAVRAELKAALEALPVRMASFEAKQKIIFDQAASTYAEQVKAAAAADVDSINAQREAEAQAFAAKKASFERRDVVSKQKIEESEKKRDEALKALQAAKASLERRGKAMSTQTLGQLEFDGAAGFIDLLQKEKAKNARLEAELDALKGKAERTEEPSYNTALTTAPKEKVWQYQKIPPAPVPAVVTPPQPVAAAAPPAVVTPPQPVAVVPQVVQAPPKSDRWAQHRLEKPLALEKARQWWALHPGSEAADIRQTAKKVVKTAAEYVPGKNDFLGVDTKRAHVRF